MENEKSTANLVIGKDHEEELENIEIINIAGTGEKNDEEEEEEEEEDRKIDKFFQLIRSFREARDRRRNELTKELATNNSNKKKRKCIDSEESGWVPRFELEDLMQPIPLGGINCNNVVINKEEDGESGLDLKLTL